MLVIGRMSLGLSFDDYRLCALNLAGRFYGTAKIVILSWRHNDAISKPAYGSRGNAMRPMQA